MPETKQGSGRGFGSTDEDKQRQPASEGGEASAGKFSNDPDREAEAGKDSQMAPEGGTQRQQGSGQDDLETGEADDHPDHEREQAEGGRERQQGSESGQIGGSGTFANDPERASEAGRSGGQS